MTDEYNGEEQREWIRRAMDRDLLSLVEDHIERFDTFTASLLTGNMRLPNGKTMMETVAEHDDLRQGQEDILTMLAGPLDPILDTRHGGLAGDVGEVKRAVWNLEHKSENGGVNARVKFTTAQKVTIAVVGIPALATAIVGALSLLQAMVERM